MSTVQVEREDVRELIRSRRYGLGRILIMRGIPSTFTLERVGDDNGMLWREYRLEGAGVSYAIREEFPPSLAARFPGSNDGDRQVIAT